MKSVLSGCLLASSAAVGWLGVKSSEPAQPAAVETVQARVVESRQQQVPVSLRSTGTSMRARRRRSPRRLWAASSRCWCAKATPCAPDRRSRFSTTPPCAPSLAQAQAGVKAAENQQAAAQTNAELAASTLERYKQLRGAEEREPAGDG